MPNMTRFHSYADCEAYASSHVYNALVTGWHVTGFLILRYHVSGSFRLFRQYALIREFQPEGK